MIISGVREEDFVNVRYFIKCLIIYINSGKMEKNLYNKKEAQYIIKSRKRLLVRRYKFKIMKDIS